MTTRRGFLTGVAALLAAPVVVRAGVLMPVRSIIIPPPPVPPWCPPGWLPCDGRSISAIDFPQLASVLREVGGFVPDMRSQFERDLPPYPPIFPHVDGVRPHDRPLRPKNFALQPIICVGAGEGKTALPAGMVSYIIARE